MVDKRILLVDDDQDLLSLLKEVLTAEGYEVRCTESPQVALKLAETNDFPVILLDMNLPLMSGTALCREIRKLCGRSVIIAWTGDTFWRREECLDAGFDQLLYKPLSLSELVAVANESFLAYLSGAVMGTVRQ